MPAVNSGALRPLPGKPGLVAEPSPMKPVARIPPEELPASGWTAGPCVDGLYWTARVAAPPRDRRITESPDPACPERKQGSCVETTMARRLDGSLRHLRLNRLPWADP